MACILIVDDEDAVRFTLREMLAGTGHDIVEATNGSDALNVLGDASCDLVITDIIMPDKEGVELIQQLRETHRDLPVIAISGGGRTRNLDFLDIARHYGANAILSKPFTRTTLLAAVAEYITVDPPDTAAPPA